jgi:hypothetical protein
MAAKKDVDDFSIGVAEKPQSVSDEATDASPRLLANGAAVFLYYPGLMTKFDDLRSAASRSA